MTTYEGGVRFPSGVVFSPDPSWEPDDILGGVEAAGAAVDGEGAKVG